MTEQKNDLAIKLDIERRREIDEIRKGMENFLRVQIEQTNELKRVVDGQNTLKERFETGTAATLRELKKSFDEFRMEWGTKKAEDKNRDEQIADAKKRAEESVSIAGKAKEAAEKIIMGFAYAIFGSLALVALIWGLSAIFKHGV